MHSTHLDHMFLKTTLRIIYLPQRSVLLLLHSMNFPTNALSFRVVKSCKQDKLPFARKSQGMVTSKEIYSKYLTGVTVIP